jgi:hypothetical protein
MPENQSFTAFVDQLLAQQNLPSDNNGKTWLTEEISTAFVDFLIGLLPIENDRQQLDNLVTSGNDEQISAFLSSRIPNFDKQVTSFFVNFQQGFFS